jgi:threonine dehydrogenase-like Zn-dependent dehydrogenase
MKAAQLYSGRDIRVVDVAEPEPKDGEAIVEVEWCGICGSDLKEYTSVWIYRSPNSFSLVSKA